MPLTIDGFAFFGLVDGLVDVKSACSNHLYMELLALVRCYCCLHNYDDIVLLCPEDRWRGGRRAGTCRRDAALSVLYIALVATPDA